MTPCQVLGPKFSASLPKDYTPLVYLESITYSRSSKRRLTFDT